MTIHAFKDDVSYPAVYVLMPNRRLLTYKTVFRRLRQAAEDQSLVLSPAHVMMDFELAEINAFRAIFPEADVTGCYFHHVQAVVKALRKRNLARAYKHDADVNSIVKLCTCLAFLPPEDIEPTFLLLKRRAPEVL